MRDIVDEYPAGLRAAWESVDDDVWEEWGEEPPLPMLALTHGASDVDLARLQERYPSCPDTLLDLLRRVDGTYCRDYAGHEVNLLVLGSDVGGYPYHLLSVAQILESASDPLNAETIRQRYGDDLEECLPAGRESSWGEVAQVRRWPLVRWLPRSLRRRVQQVVGLWRDLRTQGSPSFGNLDDRIDPDLPSSKWLHFSDCMNNGGTSQLYVDFDPLGEGRAGQIVRFLHDSDSYDVIADSFEEYLQQLIDTDYPFALPDNW